tara:strand:- start:218 stop:556 length:339 start_codon:yes stop_codon:yes gene_type:complete
MANTFKSRHLTSISHTGAETIVTGASSTQTIIIGLQLANKGASEIKATVTINNNADSDTGDITLLHQVAIPKNSMVSVFVGDKVVMEASDALKILSDTASALDATASFLEIT